MEPIIKSALANLKTAIEVKTANTTDPMIQVKSGDGSLMLLGYYRNSLGHIYAFEGLIACCGKTSTISKNELKENAEYLGELLHDEYIAAPASFDSTLALLKSKKVVSETVEGLIKFENSAWKIYLGSFIWPLIECYWGTALSLPLLTSSKICYSDLCLKVQWFGRRMYEEGILKNVESYNFDSTKAAIDQYIEMGLLKKQEKTIISLSWDNEKLKALLLKLNTFRMIPTDSLDKAIEIAGRITKTEFLMVTKI